MLQSAVLGLSIAMPFGPVSVLCMQHTLSAGLRSGLLAGLGAAVAHGAFAATAGLASGASAALLADWHGPARLVSAIILAGLGLRMLLRPVARVAQCGRPGLAFSACLALALSNPLTILPYIAASSAMAASGGSPSPAAAAIGAMAGSLAWYATLGAGAALVPSRLAQSWTPWLRVVSGAALLLYGAGIEFGWPMAALHLH